MKKIVIIGAGPAGLTAAYELLKTPGRYQITILEECSEVGGIAKTIKYKENRMDLGGHRFFSKDEKIMQWWQDILPLQGKPAFDDLLLERNNTYPIKGPDPEKEDAVMLKRKRISRIYYKNKFFDYPVSLSLNTVFNMGIFTTIVAGFSYLWSMLKKLPETSLENFYINRFGRRLYAMFFEGYTEKIWGRHPRDISADWGAQRVKGLSLWGILKNVLSKILPQKKRKIETSLIEEFIYPKFGPGQLWETVAEKISEKGGKIIKNAKVTDIISDENRVTAVVYQKGKESINEAADVVISSMPLCELIAGIKDAPKEIKNIAANLPYRDFITVGVQLSHLKIKNTTKLKTLNNLIPDCWIYVQDTGIKLGRIQIFNNWSPYLVAKPEENIWLGLEYFCNENDKYWKASDEQWRQIAAKELVKIDIITDGNDIRDYHVERVKKAYPAYFDSYKDIGKITDYINKFDNLYCIGRNGQHRYNNMDHSMATAFKAVEHIKGKLDNKQDLWQVNTEKEYHEIRKK